MICHNNSNIIIIIIITGLLVLRGKKSKISRDFQGQICGKIGWFHGKKSQNSRKNRLISRDFSWKSQISRDFRGQETINKKQPISLDFFGQISLKSLNFVSIWPALFNVVFLTGIIIRSFNNSSLEKSY